MYCVCQHPSRKQGALALQSLREFHKDGDEGIRGRQCSGEPKGKRGSCSRNLSWTWRPADKTRDERPLVEGPSQPLAVSRRGSRGKKTLASNCGPPSHFRLAPPTGQMQKAWQRVGTEPASPPPGLRAEEKGREDLKVVQHAE